MAEDNQKKEGGYSEILQKRFDEYAQRGSAECGESHIADWEDNNTAPNTTAPSNHNGGPVIDEPAQRVPHVTSEAVKKRLDEYASRGSAGCGESFAADWFGDDEPAQEAPGL